MALMQPPRQKLKQHLYAFAALLATLCVGVAGLRDPLPRLVPGQASPSRLRGAGVPAPALIEESVPQTSGKAAAGAPEELRDALAAPAASALGAARMTGAWTSAAFAATPRAAGRAAGGIPAGAAAAAAKALPGAQSRPAGPAGGPRSADAARAVAAPRLSRTDAASGSSDVSTSARPLDRAAANAERSAAAGGRSAGAPAPPRGAASGQSPSERLWKLSGSRPASGSPEQAAEQAARRRRRHRPLIHRRRRAPGPPRAAKPPKGNPWRNPPPPATEDGRPLQTAPPATLSEIEAVVPPAGEPDRLPAAHWHLSGAVQFYHDGRRWGRSSEGRWSWLEQADGRWWLWADAQEPPLVWHESHWWWQSRGRWFVLHDGQAWAYRYLPEWRQDGLAHEDGSRILYSPDGGRVGLVEPGAGARFFDNESGEALGWTADKALPERDGPRAPAQLSLPR